MGSKGFCKDLEECWARFWLLGFRLWVFGSLLRIVSEASGFRFKTRGQFGILVIARNGPHVSSPTHCSDCSCDN